MIEGEIHQEDITNITIYIIMKLQTHKTKTDRIQGNNRQIHNHNLTL